MNLQKEYPSIRFSEFTESWKGGRLKDVSTFYNGRAFKQAELLSSGKYPVLRVGNLFTNNQWYHSDLELEHNKFIERGDLIYAWSATFGPHIWQREKAIYHYHIWKIEPDKLNLDKQFYYHLLYNETAKMKAKSSNGFAMLHITKGTIENWTVSFPSLPEQQKIASFLSAVDTKIDLLRKKKDLLEKYKKGVMQKIFSQEIRYKDENGNDFPDWEEKRLGEISKIYDGTHQTPKYVSEGIPFYSVEHVTANQFKDTKFISRDVFEKENKRVKLDKNDILMTRIGSIGKAKLIDWDVEASFYVSLALIKSNEEVENSYLVQLIKTVFFQKELWKRTIHVAFPQKINLGEISNCHVLLPCVDEQLKIGKFLGSFDSKIETLESRIEQTEQFKKGLLQQMFV